MGWGGGGGGVQQLPLYHGGGMNLLVCPRVNINDRRMACYLCQKKFDKGTSYGTVYKNKQKGKQSKTRTEDK